MWSSLESLPGLSAAPVIWRRRWGEDFDRFAALCLESTARTVRYYPCPIGCGCWHEVFPLDTEPGAANEGGISRAKTDRSSPSADRATPSPSFLARCQCRSRWCLDFKLTGEEVTPLKVNLPKFNRALRKALGLDAKTTEFPVAQTTQVGSWSVDATPVILTIQTDSLHFRLAVAELVARLRKPFILLSPTSTHLDAACHELLSGVNAACLTLETSVGLTDHGSLRPKKSPGELFAQFTPQPKGSVDEDTARRAFALISSLDDDSRRRAPNLLTVFRLYCTELLTTEQIAKRCHCSKSAVVVRLNAIRVRVGANPQDLRRLSVHFRQIDEIATDTKARIIHGKALIYDGLEGDEAEA